MKRFLGAAFIAFAAYYAFIGHSRTTGPHVNAAITYQNEAAAIFNKQPGIIGIIPPEDARAIMDLNKKALTEAEQVDIAEMNQFCAGFGDHIRDDLIAGLELVTGSDGVVSSVRGQMLLNDFGDWHNAHIDAIRAGGGQACQKQ
jgi:hypothetical protein